MARPAPARRRRTTADIAGRWRSPASGPASEQPATSSPATSMAGALRRVVRKRRVRLRMPGPELDDRSFTVAWDEPWDPAWRCGPEPRGTTVAERTRARVRDGTVFHGTVFRVTFKSREQRTLSRLERRRSRA
ncbi:hypothetical protein [Streptomyces sp. NPDC001307]|uniref:hypothetical protein n=1 Tax=Streptomyces sp. NPDC001307 TaxID=3364560 RepID=UPI0036BF711B